jgi:hypothetical protein
LVGLPSGRTCNPVVVTIWIFCLGIFKLGIVSSSGQQPVNYLGQARPENAIKSEYSFRKAWHDSLNFYTKYVRETSNMKNDHPYITAFNMYYNKHYPKLGKLQKGSAYCSTSGIYTAAKAAMTFPGVNALAYSWRQKTKLVFYPAMLKGNSRRKPDIKLMDAVILNFSHVEFVGVDFQGSLNFDEKGIYTMACNTRGGKKRLEGCYASIFRPWSLVAGIYNHVGPWYLETVYKPKRQLAPIYKK